MYDAWCIHLYMILIHACMMYISLAFDPWPWCMYVWCIHLLSLILTHVCMMHVFMMRHICHTWTNLDPDAYIHYACMHDAYTYAPWSLCICAWCIYVWCIHLWSLILDYAACVYDAAEILSPTDERTDEQGDSRSRIHDPDTCVYDAFIMFLDPWLWCMCVWCTYLWSSILDPDTCMYDASIYVPRSLTILHVCMMHISMILDPWLWSMCVWCTYLWSSILDPDACVYVWCMYLWCDIFR